METVPVTKKEFAGTFPANNNEFAGTVLKIGAPKAAQCKCVYMYISVSGGP